MILMVGITTVIVVAIIIGIVFIVSGMMMEKKDYNNGRCPKCDKPLRYFDTDSQGGRGYICDKCGYTTWVSYGRIDRRHR